MSCWDLIWQVFRENKYHLLREFWCTSNGPKEKAVCNTVNHLLLFSHPVVSDSSRPHRLQHARSPCPSPSPEGCQSSCPLHWWCHPAISSSDALFSFCPQSFPALGTFPMNPLFASDDQNTGASALASVLPMNIQGWFPSVWLSYLSKLNFSMVLGFKN